MEKPNFKKICKMYIQQLTDFPYIEKDFDALTDYGLLCKIVSYLNKVIENQNTQNESIINLYNAFVALKDYVDNYFDNLDVQDEINNKLDAMAEDGTLENLIGAYIQPRINAQNIRINQIDSKVDAISSGTPTPVSSISNMTDTSKAYLLTTDGYWYYYNGETWTRGGVYQATSIGNGEVKYNNLNNELKSKVNLNLINKKYDFIINNKVINDSTHILVDYQNGACLHFPNDKAYILKLSSSVFITNNRSNFTGYYCDGVDGENYVQHNIRESFKASENPIMLLNPYDKNNEYIYYLILPNSSYDYYLNIKTLNYNMGDYDIYAYDDVKNGNALKYISNNYTNDIDYEFKDLKYNNFIIAGFPYWQGSTFTVGDITGGFTESTHVLQTGRSILIPKENNNDVYIYKAINNYVASFDENLSISSFTKETSEKNIIFKNESLFKWKITDNTKSFIIPITHIGNNEYTCYTSNHDISNTNITSINNQNINNNIPIKNWYTFGDSITNKNRFAFKNYIDWICEDLNIINTNYAISGMGYKKGEQNFIEQITHMDTYNPETDIITVMGSINDMEYVPNDLGQLGDTTTDTLYGCFYTFFNDLITKFNGLRIGIISPITNIHNHNNPSNMEQYITALENTAKYFNIPFLNLYNQSNLRPWNSKFLNYYYLGDGVGGGTVDDHGTHPNSKGHQLFYGRIKEFIKSL